MKKLFAALTWLAMAMALSVPVAMAAKPVADTKPPVTTASPVGGTFSAPVTVTLTVNEPATTYYTVDGTTPTTGSAVYSQALNFSASTTLKYFSKDTAGNTEAVQSQIYTISTGGGSTTHSTLTWNGYGMCSTSTCHSGRASAVHSSVHYQWKSDASEMTTGPAAGQGKLDALDGSSAINAYCVNIQGTWGPCGSCHVGAGARPTSTLTPSNIDCLICHNDAVNAPYSRVRNATTGLFEPAAGLDMNLVVQKAGVKPARKNCLGACHAKAGGGDGVKRGDLALATVTFANPADDAHMATGGGNMTCQACHTFTNHRVMGRGSDLRPQDSATDLNCSSTTCHPTKAASTGHVTSDVNHHVDRVACQSCHIKTYARGFLTEVDRDWSATAEWNATLGRYEPHHTMAGNVAPKYAFWDGTSWGSNVGDAAVLDPATGAYKISRPNGLIDGPLGTKFYPFKYKTAHQPLADGKLIALKVATFFGTANYDQAVKDGMTYMGIPTTTPYATVLTDEYQVLNHQVEPAGSAMTCAGCHENTTVNLKGMGYTLKGEVSVICSQCHRAKTPGGYTRIHSHSLNKGFDCSWCHNFSRPERGLTLP